MHSSCLEEGSAGDHSMSGSGSIVTATSHYTPGSGEYQCGDTMIHGIDVSVLFLK